MKTISSFSGKFHFLSNFYQVVVEYDSVSYPSVEHAFQAAKVLDPDARLAIALCKKPSDAKRLGRRLRLRGDWETVKVDIMRDLLRQKFRHTDLARRLVDTEPADIIEGNNWGDFYWGAVWNRETHQWEGENMLGRLLMDIRTELEREGMET